MAQLLSSKNLFLSSDPLVVGVVPDPHVFEALSAAPAGEVARSCDLAELRLDLLPSHGAEERQKAQAMEVPLLVTARHPSEGGQAPESAADRIAMLEPWLEVATAMDIELQSLGEIREFAHLAQGKGVGVVGSFHDFQRTPSDEILEGAAGLAEAAGIDVVKVATHLTSEDDLVRLIRFVTRERRVRVAAMGMGHLGRVSRLVLAKCGSLLNYGFLGEAANVDGQWPAAELQSLLAKL